MTYNMAMNGMYYNPLTAQAITSMNSNYLNQAYTNSSGIFDYANNSYMNSVANNSGLNTSLNNYDPYSMNYSLGGNYSTAGLGYGLGCGMGCYPGYMGYGPGSEVMGMTQADYLRYQENLQNQSIDMQTRTRKKLNAADYDASAGEKTIKEKIEILHSQIENNNQDNVAGAYGELTSAVGSYLKKCGYVNADGAVDSEYLKSYTNDLYEKVAGVGISSDLKANGDSYFIQGLKQGVLGFGIWGSVNRKNRGDNVSSITGTPVTRSDKGWRLTGQIVGGAATFVAGCLLFKNGAKAFRTIGGAIGKFLFH